MEKKENEHRVGWCSFCKFINQDGFQVPEICVPSRVCGLCFLLIGHMGWPESAHAPFREWVGRLCSGTISNEIVAYKYLVVSLLTLIALLST